MDTEARLQTPEGRNDGGGALGRFDDDRTKAFIAEHARLEYPREACGLVIRKGHKQRPVACRNIALFPRTEFRIAASAFQRAEDEGEVLACYHSHVNTSPAPSDADKTVAENVNLPFIVIGWPTCSWQLYTPCGWRAALVGRPYFHGILDCYTLVQDYYREKLRIELPDFDRGEGEWWERGANLYEENYAALGFSRISDAPREHDVILMQLPPSPVICHAAVYLGDGHMIQHLTGRISGVTTYFVNNGYFAKATRKIVRHESLQ
jgi:cell wall-associated NlpC family hydrolase